MTLFWGTKAVAQAASPDGDENGVLEQLCTFEIARDALVPSSPFMRWHGDFVLLDLLVRTATTSIEHGTSPSATTNTTMTSAYPSRFVMRERAGFG